MILGFGWSLALMYSVGLVCKDKKVSSCTSRCVQGKDEWTVDGHGSIEGSVL